MTDIALYKIEAVRSARRQDLPKDDTLLETRAQKTGRRAGRGPV